MSEQSLKAYIPQQYLALDIAPLEILALLVLSSLPRGLYGTRQWFADLLQKDKAQISRVIKSLREHNLIYNDVSSGDSVIKVNNAEILRVYNDKLAKGLIKKERRQDTGLLAPMTTDADINAHDYDNTILSTCGKTCGETVGNFATVIDGVDYMSTGALIKCQQYVDYKSTIYTSNNKFNNKYIYLNKEKIKKEKNFVVTYDETGHVTDSQFTEEAEKDFLAEVKLIRQAYLDSLKQNLDVAVSDYQSDSIKKDPEDLPCKSYRAFGSQGSNDPKIQQGGKSSGTSFSARSSKSKIHTLLQRKKGAGAYLANQKAQESKTLQTPSRIPGQAMPFSSGAEFFSQFFEQRPDILAKWQSTDKGRSILADLGFAH